MEKPVMLQFLCQKVSSSSKSRESHCLPQLCFFTTNAKRNSFLVWQVAYFSRVNPTEGLVLPFFGKFFINHVLAEWKDFTIQCVFTSKWKDAKGKKKQN